MEFLAADFFFSMIGWIFLHVKFRNREKIAFTKEREYEDSYAVAGRAVAFKALLIFFGLLLIGIVIAGIFGTIKSSQ